MTVYLLKREDQNQHGFIDVSIIGIFRNEKDAKQEEAVERTGAREEGLRIEDEDDNDGDWDVCWRLEDYQLQQTQLVWQPGNYSPRSMTNDGDCPRCYRRQGLPCKTHGHHY